MRGGLDYLEKCPKGSSLGLLCLIAINRLTADFCHAIEFVELSLESKAILRLFLWDRVG
jgi:hypothetical protein